MTGKVLRFGIPAALASFGLLTSGSPAAAAQRTATTCSTDGLAFSSGKSASYKVVQLGAEGVPCSKARTVAQRVALDLLHGRSISLDGVSSFGMATTSCGGCGPATTKVSLTYPNGKITVSLSGKGPAASPSTPAPTIPFPTIPANPFPTIPSPSAPSSGKKHVITV